MKKILVSLILLVSTITAYCEAESYFFTIGTGGITGTYYPVGVAIGKLINIDRKEHGVTVTVEPTGGSVANIKELTKGMDFMAMAIVQSDAQYNAYNGLGAFSAPNKDIRALFGLYSEVYTVVARNNSGIKSFNDVERKRFNLGNAGSGSRTTTELILNEYKWTMNSFSLATEYQPAEMVAALCDNKIDAFAYVIGNPNAAIEQALSCNAHLVPVTGAHIDSLIKKYPFFPKADIPAGTYKMNSESVTTFGPKATFITTASLPENAAYEITKTVYENFDSFKNMHPALKSMRKEDLLTGNSVPYHPAAIKYYKEIGVWKN